MKKKLFVLLMAVLLLIPLSGKKTAAEGNKLPTPSNLHFDGNVLKWDAIEGASYYQVQITAIISEPTYFITDDPEIDLVQKLAEYAEVYEQYVTSQTGKITATVCAIASNIENNSEKVDLDYYVYDITAYYDNYEQSQGYIEGLEPVNGIGHGLFASEGNTVVLNVLPADGLTFNSTGVDHEGYTETFNKNSKTITIAFNNNAYEGRVDLQFVDDVVDVTIDFGSKHADFLAAQYAAANLSDEDKQHFEVNGSVLKVKGVSGSMSFEYFWDDLDYMFEDTLLAYWGGVEDNGEVYYDYGFKQASAYSTYGEYYNEYEDDNNIMRDHTELYVIWIAYDVTEGDGQTWEKGSSDPAVFRFVRNFVDGGDDGFPSSFGSFKDLSVDGKTLTKNTDYTVEEGSTVIKLLPSYLKTLKKGEHTLKVNYYDDTNSSGTNYGSATAKFTISDSDPVYNVPDTSVK